jgi:RNA polymerase sigma factor (sigma-70 family)
MPSPSNSGLSDFEHAALPHMNAAHNLAFWLVRSRPDAEDIVQEAYLRAFRAYATLEGDDIRPWLLTIVRNVAYRWLSKRRGSANVISFQDAFPARPGEAFHEPDIPSDAPSAEALLIGSEERAMVAEAVARLPTAYREVLVLREIEELSYRDIADVLGVPSGTVMSRLSRARAELKIVLTELMSKDVPHAQ